MQGVEFWAVNTDAQALAAHQALNKLQIGSELTRGLGCGGNPDLGRQAALESQEAIKKMVQVRSARHLVVMVGGCSAAAPNKVHVGWQAEGCRA